MRADIARILPFSSVDGPGNRLVVFYQGCNLRCAHCHNPETWQACRQCGTCVRVCPAGALTLAAGRVRHAPSRCTDCGACLAVCRHHSSPKTRSMSLTEVLAVIRTHRPYLSGVTLSGGEPTLQHEFVAALCRRLRRLRLPVLVESNGVMPLPVLRALLPLVQGFIIDCKGDNAAWPVLREAARRGKLFEVRFVVMPGRGAGNTAMVSALSALLARIGRDVPLRLVAFRRQGVRGALCRAATPTVAVMRRLQASARRAGVRQVLLT